MAKRILIVDDSTSVRTVAGIALREAGYAVVEAGNGQEGLARLDGERIHLIISDVNMPNMDGLEATRLIRRHVNAAKIPIVAMSAHCDGPRWQVFHSNCVQWLKKPWVLDDLCQILNRFWLRTTHEAVSKPKENVMKSFAAAGRDRRKTA